MRGITLLAVGNINYMYWAFNQALSIKTNSPKIPIQLLTEKGHMKHLDKFQRSFFDVITHIPEEEIYFDVKMGPRRTERKIVPCNVKTQLYKWLHWDKTIYLDVDGITIRDLNPLFDLCDAGKYYAQWAGKGKKGEKWSQMVWATSNKVFDHYKLSPDATVRFINSSFHYITKGDHCKKIFEQAHRNFLNPIPLDELQSKWGGSQPDELYMNVAYTQLGVNPRLPGCPRPVYFSMRHVHPGNVNELYQNHYGIGLWGVRQQNHGLLMDYYDKVMLNYCKLRGISHLFKAGNMMGSKFAKSG